MSRAFLSIHNDWDEYQTLPFVVPAGDGGTAYRQPTWGIEIVSVIAGASEIEGQPDTGFEDDLDFRAIDTAGAALVYQMPIVSLLTASPFLSETEFGLLRYALPVGVPRLEVRYRPRFAPGVTTEDCVIVSVLGA